MKRNKICPFCFLKKIFVKPQQYSGAPAPKFDNGAAKTPPMGWSSWNCFRNRIDEEQILKIGEAMVKAGLTEAGYLYLNLDDCWQSSLRDERGRLQGDLSAFPSGIPALIKKLNTLGLKVGLYASNGTLTCEDMPSSLGCEKLDAATIAEWGAEYFKYDFCHHRYLPKNAPLITAVEIFRRECDDRKLYSAEGARLFGFAKLRADKHGLKFISGLDAALGIAEFEVEAMEDGDYVLTAIIKKHGHFEKFCLAEINGVQYELEAPPCNHFNQTTRRQIIIKLQKGKNIIRFYNPIKKGSDSAAYQYRNMARYLDEAAKAAGKSGKYKPIVFSICEWGLNRPYHWGASAGNLWRTTPDIRPIWPWIMLIYRHNLKLYKYGVVGGYNDPDMLEVGNGKLTDEEGAAHFALWCMMAAPLILGNDLRKFIADDGSVIKSKTLETVTDSDLIAIDQDPLCKPAKMIKRGGGVDIIARPLADGSAAVLALNAFGGEKNVKINLDSIVKDGYAGLAASQKYSVYSVTDKSQFESSGVVTVTLPRHSAKVYKIKNI